VIHRQEIVNRMVALPFIVSRAANAVCLRANAACDSGALRQPLFPSPHKIRSARCRKGAPLPKHPRAPLDSHSRHARHSHQPFVQGNRPPMN
jgi:hypothetical protein